MSSQIQDYIKALRNMDRLLKRLVDRRRRIEQDFFAETDLSFVFDTNGNFMYVSETTAEFLGFTSREMENHNWREMGLPASIMLPVEQQLQSVFATGRPEAGSVKFMDEKSQQTIYLDYYLRPIYKNNGYIGAVICTAKNVTAARRNEEFAQRSAVRFKQVIDLCPLPILVLDVNGIITLANREALRYFSHHNPDEIIGSSYRLILDLLGLKQEDSLVLKALQGETFTGVFRDLNNLKLLISAIPLFDPETNGTTGVMAVYQDITEYQQMQDNLTRLDCLNLIGEMAAGVAHEVRNPLTVIRGYLQYMQSKGDIQYRDQFGLVMDELTRVEGIITDFLSLARRQRNEPAYCDLNQIIKSLLPLLTAEGSKQGIEVQYDFAENLPAVLVYDTEIKQLILNLARNGIEAMNGQGLLAFATRRIGNEVFLLVSDTGSGIPPEIRERIFQPFFSTKEKGTGMGLAVCTRIIEHHHGHIEVQSVAGCGTTFRVGLPLL